MRKQQNTKLFGLILKGVAKRLVLLAVLCVGVAFSAAAQTASLSGKVTDQNGMALPGANVYIKGTTIGTISDMDGNFTLSGVPSGNQTLVATFVGYTNQEQSVTVSDASQSVSFSLTEDAVQVEEVVAIGYGTQKKKLVTGATVQVKGDDIQKMNTNNPLQALQGQTPGVNITSTSGQPGASMSVSIRGLGTVGNSQPLYLIDGVGGDISTLNPSDIESIDVLKDAASAAIYGAQAANGVVLITTKSGKEGKAQISFDSYYGIQTVANQISMLNSTDYMMIMNEAALNSGKKLYNWATQYPDLFNADGTPINNTDWIDEALADKTYTQSYNLSVSGGTKTSTYAMSLGYMDQDGIVGGSDVSYYKRYNFRINSEHKLLNNYVTIGEHASVIWKESRGMGTGNIYHNGLRSCFSTSPLIPVYDAEGEYYNTNNSSWSVSEGNPIGSMMVGRYNQTRGATVDANAYAVLEPVKNLKLKTVFGISYSTSDYRAYTPIYQLSSVSQNSVESVNQSSGHGMSRVWTNTLSYDFKIAEIHSFNTLIGCESSQYDGSSISGSNTDLVAGFGSWETAYLSNTQGTTAKSLQGKPYDSTRGMSYFGRLGYTLKDTYMLNATLRCDGSSKFASGNRFGYFPSVSAGWVITNESFMESTASVLNFLKLRASWGQVGNANIKCYQYLAPVTKGSGSDVPYANYNFGNAGGQDAWVTGTYPSTLANEDLTWETSEQLNIGFDARLFDSRLNVTFECYKKDTKDWLVQAPVLATSGVSTQTINGGSVENTGVEFSASWSQQIIKDLNVTFGANFAYNKNEVGEIPSEDGIIHGASNQIWDNAPEYYRAQNGHQIGYFWGYQTAGVFQNQKQINEWLLAGNGTLQDNPKPGDVIYVDQDTNGTIDEDDQVDLGCGIPKMNFGLNLSVNYKGFDFSATATGAAGFKILQAYRSPTNYQQNYSEAILDRWTGEGTSNSMPRVTQTDVGNWDFSDLYLQDGDYLRIQNVTLGYDFKRFINWQYISQCRLYFQVQNLITFTGYTGMDPEIGSYNGVDGNSSDTWVSGVDMGYYPHPRTFLFGLNLKF